RGGDDLSSTSVIRVSAQPGPGRVDCHRSLAGRPAQLIVRYPNASGDFRGDRVQSLLNDPPLVRGSVPADLRAVLGQPVQDPLEASCRFSKIPPPGSVLGICVLLPEHVLTSLRLHSSHVTPFSRL